MAAIPRPPKDVLHHIAEFLHPTRFYYLRRHLPWARAYPLPPPHKLLTQRFFEDVVSEASMWPLHEEIKAHRAGRPRMVVDWRSVALAAARVGRTRLVSMLLAMLGGCANDRVAAVDAAARAGQWKVCDTLNDPGYWTGAPLGRVIKRFEESDRPRLDLVRLLAHLVRKKSNQELSDLSDNHENQALDVNLSALCLERFGYPVESARLIDAWDLDEIQYRPQYANELAPPNVYLEILARRTMVDNVPEWFILLTCDHQKLIRATIADGCWARLTAVAAKMCTAAQLERAVGHLIEMADDIIVATADAAPELWHTVYAQAVLRRNHRATTLASARECTPWIVVLEQALRGGRLADVQAAIAAGGTPPPAVLPMSPTAPILLVGRYLDWLDRHRARCF